MSKRVAIWGTGKAGLAFLGAYRDELNIVCFYDNDKEKWGTSILGVPVKSYNSSDDCFVIVASEWWKEISVQLLSSGKRAGIDFIQSTALNKGMFVYRELYELQKYCKQTKRVRIPMIFSKKVACVYGNCQTAIIGKMLQNNKLFRDEYCLVQIPMVCEWEFCQELMQEFIEDSVFWKCIDLFIYQTVNQNNRFSSCLCTVNIIKKLKTDTKLVSIVNIYFDGYFPQLPKRIGSRSHKNYPIRWNRGDLFVDELLKEGYCKEDILSKIQQNSFIGRELIKNRVEESFDELERRERTCHVKIVDYLRKNISKELLFFAPNHPINSVISEYTNRILTYLGFEICDSDPNDYLIFDTLQGQDVPLYKDVFTYFFGCIDNDRKYYIDRYIYGEIMPMSFTEYMELYIDANI